MKSQARPNQLITLARCRRKTLPIKYRDLPSAAFNQTGTFQLLGSIADAWPLDTQHFGEQILSDGECGTVAAVTRSSVQLLVQIPGSAAKMSRAAPRCRRWQPVFAVMQHSP